MRSLLWWVAGGGLGLATLVAAVAVVTGTVGLVRHDKMLRGSAGADLLLAIVAAGLCIGGGVVLLGGNPLFCF